MNFLFFFGLKKVTWVEHVEVDDSAGRYSIFKHLICTGQAFAANRWVAALVRQCERISSMLATDFQSVDSGDHISILTTKFASNGKCFLSFFSFLNRFVTLCSANEPWKDEHAENS